jgi:glycosyltransferase involved in cell wall biosynthesis
LNTDGKTQISYAAILTTFNAEDSIDQAIQSILNQDTKASEIWIIDDCSTDNSLVRINSWANKNDTIRVIRNEKNSGQSFGRNFAGFNSKSKLLIFFDDDDISNSKRATAHIEMYLSGADLSFVSSQKIYPNQHTTVFKNKRIINLCPKPYDYARKLLIGLTIESVTLGWVPACSMAITRAAFEKLHGFDENFRRLEDAELVIRASKSAALFSWTEEILVSRNSTYSDDKGGIIETKFELALLEKHSDLFSKNEIREGKNLIKARSLYFGKRYLSLVIFIALHPDLISAYPVRIKRFAKRILHDLRK